MLKVPVHVIAMVIKVLNYPVRLSIDALVLALLLGGLVRSLPPGALRQGWACGPMNGARPPGPQPPPSGQNSNSRAGNLVSPVR